MKSASRKSLDVMLKTDSEPWFSKIVVTLELVTPETAESWLSQNIKNYRKKIRSNLFRMVSDMKSGRWSFTNATIAFDVNDILSDGQHRLMAIVESGTSQWFLVVRGMPEGSCGDPSTDTGARRNVATHLSNTGFVNTGTVASVARNLIKIKKGYKITAGGTNQPSDSEVADFVKKTQLMNESAAVAQSLYKTITPSVGGAWYWLACCEDKELADSCVRIMLGQDEALNTHPFAKCKECLLELKSDKKKGVVDIDFQLRLLFSAWEKAKKGETVKLIRPVATFKISDKADRILQGAAS